MTEEVLETERRIVTTAEELHEATIEVASRAERTLTILTPDLEPGLYDSVEFLEAVKRLVLAKSYSRVRALITDPAHAVRTGNKFVALSQRLNTCIEIRNLHQQYRGSMTDAFIIADDQRIFYRSDGRSCEGIVGSREPEIVRQHLDRYRKPWEDSVFRHPARQNY